MVKTVPSGRITVLEPYERYSRYCGYVFYVIRKPVNQCQVPSIFLPMEKAFAANAPVFQ